MSINNKENQPHIFTPEFLSSEILTPEKIREISDFFRYIFCNADGFGQYLFYPSEGIAIPPQHVFSNYQKSDYVPLEVLDGFDPNDFPVHPETGEKAIFWHDPDFTNQIFNKKLEKDGHVCVLKDDCEEIAGIMLGHLATVDEVFHSEEWHNSRLYSGLNSPQFNRSFEKFLTLINESFQGNPVPIQNVFPNHVVPTITPETEIYSWNCVASKPEARNPVTTQAMMEKFFDGIPEDIINNNIVIGETVVGSKAHTIFRTYGLVETPGFLTDSLSAKLDDLIIGSTSLRSIVDTHMLPISEFQKRIQQVLSEK